MAHIPEGILNGQLVATGFALSGALSVLSGRKLRFYNIPKISLVTAAVFCASLIHVPFMGTSVHFTFVGLAGMLLGPVSFLSVLAAVFFQGMLFGHGGVSTLGVNAFNIGMAALTGYLIFRVRLLFPDKPGLTVALAFASGFGAALVMVVLLAGTLVLNGFPPTVIGALFLAYLPVVFGEGLVTGFLAAALAKTRKDLLYNG
jgi:cobalt/nickel transport system permease protein